MVVEVLGFFTFFLTAFFFGFFTLQVPAGLTLYWVTSNLLQMLQQWAIPRYFVKKSPAPAVATSAAGATTITGEAKVVGTKSEKPADGAANPPATRSASNNGTKNASRTKAKGK